MNRVDSERILRQVGVPDGNVVLDLFVLHQRVGDLMEAALRGTDVRPAEFAVYSQLGIASLTPRELSARLGVTASTLTGHLAALARRGHTRKKDEPSDRRSYRLEPTPAGRAALEECRREFRIALAALERQLDVDPEQVRRVLATVDRAADRATQEISGAARPQL